MVSIQTSSQISMNLETLVETSESLGVKEASNLIAEEKNATNAGDEDNTAQLSNSAENSSETDEKYLKHFCEEEVVAERNPIKAEGNGVDEMHYRDTKMDTPSSTESFSENLSTDSDYFEAEASKSQGNDESYEKKISSKKQLLRKRFRKVVKFARKALAEARVAAQEESVAKRYEVATQKKRELQSRRAEKKREMLAIPPSRHARNKTLISSKIETTGKITWDKTEIKEIRKVHAELDRAKAKKTQVSSRRDKRVSVADTTALQPINKNSEYLNYEVECLVKELHSLNLPEKASELARAFSRKVDTERELRSQLKKDKREAMLEAKRQKLEELARLREEERRKQLEERARMERERREREEVERMKKLEEDRRQKIHNLHMWASFHRTGLANSISRPFTSTYFPKLHNPAASGESKQISEYSRMCSLRNRCHKGHAKSSKTPKTIT